eukprot:1178541-Prorocentrum_minimum.AAC.5
MGNTNTCRCCRSVMLSLSQLESCKNRRCPKESLMLSMTTAGPFIVGWLNPGLDTLTVELTTKTLLSHLITRKFNSPANSSRTPSVRVEP